MIEILGRTSSINVRKALWTCVELGIEFEQKEWGSGELSLASPDFLALNPHGLVPVLRDGHTVLSQSNTICRYLAARYGNGHLLPPGPAGRALVEQWMDWQATDLNDAWRYAFMALVRGSAAHDDARAIASSIANWNRHMALLDAALSKTGEFVTGATFTLADVVLGLSTHRWYSTPMERPALHAIAAYYARLATRPGFARYARSDLP